MKTLLALTATALLCLATGCVSRPEAFEPMAELTPEAEFEVSYLGGIGTDPMPEDVRYGGTDGDSSLTYTLDIRFLRAKPENAQRMFGDRAIEIGASSLPASEVTEELLSQATLVSAPRLSVFEGQTGTITILNELAYVSGFDIYEVRPRTGSGVGTPGSKVANPVVDTAIEGLMVELKVVSADKNRLKLTADVTMSEIVRPIQVQKVRLYGADVEIQVPVVYTQHMAAAGKISEDRVLVLTGMLGRDNDIYTVLISGKRVDLDEITPEDLKDD